MPSLIALKKNGSIPNSSVIVAQSHHAPKKDERSCVDFWCCCCHPRMTVSGREIKCTDEKGRGLTIDFVPKEYRLLLLEGQSVLRYNFEQKMNKRRFLMPCRRCKAAQYCCRKCHVRSMCSSHGWDVIHSKLRRVNINILLCWVSSLSRERVT